MSDLGRLIEAVEAGTFLMDVFPDGRTERIAYEAFSGSLDAALALHEALLPGWHPNVGRNVHHTVWRACVQRVGLDGEIKYFDADGFQCPARAWLLAILRAYRDTKDAQP